MDLAEAAELRRERRGREKDPFAKLTLLKGANPVLMEWCHRTSQSSLRDQINLVLDVEQRRVLDDAKSTRRRTAWRQTGTRRKTTMGVTLLTTASRGRGLRTAGPGWLRVSGPGQGTMKEEERKENVKKRKKN